MSKILITEKQLEILSQSILAEQDETVDEKQILDNLENDLNQLLAGEQNEVLSTIQLKVTGTNPEDMEVHLAGIKIPLKWNNNRRRGSFGTNKALGFGKVGTAQFLDELEKNEQYRHLLEKYPTIRDQIKDGFVKLIIRPQTPEKAAFIEIAPGSMSGKERRKIKLNLGDTFTLKDLLVNNLVNMKFDKKTKGQLFTDNMSWKLSRLALDKSSIGEETPRTDIGPITMDFNTSENFDFNRATLTPEAITQIQTQILTPISQLGTRLGGYINRLQQNPIVLTAFASRDDDPAATDYNSDPNTRSRLYQPCVTQTTRGGYNQCLSAARAQAVVDHLRETAPEIFGNVNFRPIGGGENIASGNQWVSGKTDHDFTTTRADRNFIIDLPAWTTR